VLDEPADVPALGGERREHARGLVGQLGERAVLAGQHGDHLIGLPKRGIGSLERLVQRLAVAGQPRPEAGDDQPHALLLGQPGDVVDQIQADRRGGVLDRQQVLALVGS
jgi:hypothetical protein